MTKVLIVGASGFRLGSSLATLLQGRGVGVTILRQPFAFCLFTRGDRLRLRFTYSDGETFEEDGGCVRRTSRRTLRVRAKRRLVAWSEELA